MHLNVSIIHLTDNEPRREVNGKQSHAMAHNKDNVILLPNFCLEADVSGEYDELMVFIFTSKKKIYA